MFSTLSETYIDDLINKYKDIEGSHIHIYDKIYKHINEFIKENGLLVSTDLLGFSYTYIVYGSYIFKHVNKLANELVKYTPYIRLNTIIKNKEFVLEVDGIRMLILYNIDDSFVKIMSNKTMENNNVISPDIELIDIYHKLYLPQKYNEHDNLHRNEKCVWNEFNKIREMIVMAPSVKGGGGSNVDLIEIALEWIKNNDNCILIGDKAACIMNKKNSRFSNAVQFITAGDIEKSVDELRKYILSSTDTETTIKKHIINLPDDYRIIKYTISSKNDNSYIANVYNCASYELIPYIMKEGYRIGTYPVLLRFLFMDIWFLRTLRYFNIINQKNYIMSIRNTLGNVDNIHGGFLKYNEERMVKDILFIGTYVDEVVDKKNIVSPFPYWPAKFKKENGKFREL